MDNPTGGTPYLRENFREAPFWNPTKIQPGETDGRVARMDLNECPYPPSPAVLAAIQAAAPGLNRYPDGTCPDLTPLIAGSTGVPAERITWGTGSTQLLTSILEVSVAPGENLVAPSLLWRRFEGIFKLLAADVTSVPNLDDCAIDAAGLVSAVGNATKLVICLTPNNPTGLMLAEDEVRQLARETPENVLLYIDEAYFEFARHAGGPDILAILKDRKGPWVVSRTFSKAYALAGLRLGYALCSSEQIANALRLVTSTFNIAGIAEAAALAAWNDGEYTQWILDRTADERNRIIDGLREMGLAPLPSVTNFVSVDVGRPGTEVTREMRSRGIRIATWGYETSGNYIRVSMGTGEDTDRFLHALAEVLSGD